MKTLIIIGIVWTLLFGACRGIERGRVVAKNFVAAHTDLQSRYDMNCHCFVNDVRYYPDDWSVKLIDTIEGDPEEGWVPVSKRTWKDLKFGDWYSIK